MLLVNTVRHVLAFCGRNPKHPTTNALCYAVLECIRQAGLHRWAVDPPGKWRGSDSPPTTQHSCDFCFRVLHARATVGKSMRRKAAERAPQRWEYSRDSRSSSLNRRWRVARPMRSCSRQLTRGTTSWAKASLPDVGHT